MPHLEDFHSELFVDGDAVAKQDVKRVMSFPIPLDYVCQLQVLNIFHHRSLFRAKTMLVHPVSILMTKGVLGQILEILKRPGFRSDSGLVLQDLSSGFVD